MASLLASGISSFSPQPNTEPHRIPKGFPSKLDFPKSPSPSFKLFQVRAEVGSPTKTLDPELPNPGKLLSNEDQLQKFLKRDYKWGFNENIESFAIPKGLSEETVRLISSRKNEPDWMLEFRLNSYHKFLRMSEPKWSDNRYPKIDFQNLCYYSEPKKKPTLNSLDEADPELIRYFDKLGIPLNEKNRLANVAVDAVLDSVSIATTHRKTLEESGVIFCSISEAVREHPDLVKKYLGRVVPTDDNYYAALNSAVFSDGSFCYIPKDTKCPMQISTYFRINALETGQFERTLIVAEDRSFVEYLEGCTAPSYDTNQLHAAVVELYCAEGAEIKYSTVQNWYAGDEEGKGGIYNFVTKRGLCAGARSKISWTQVETGSAITWKYPSVILEGDDTVGEFYSVALTNNYQQADTGTKMIHKGKNTRSRIISKGISAGNSRNCYRGLVQVYSRADNARNSSQCDSMLIGDNAAANTYPYIQNYRLNWASPGGGEKRSDGTPEFTIFVGDLAPDVRDQVLQQTFSPLYPSVKGAKIVADMMTGRAKGYGFVRFGDESEQSRAMHEMNGKFCSTRPMRIGPANQKNTASFPATRVGTQTEDDPNNTRIFVGGLNDSVKDDQLRQVFSQFGMLIHVKIPEGKRCGFVQFADRNSAEEALRMLNGTQLGGNNIRLSWGCSPPNKQPQQDPNQVNGGYYGYAQGQGAYGYAAAVQDPNLYYGGYPGYGNYQQPQQL